MTRHRPGVPLPLILTLAAVVILGSLARLYETDRMLVWHDEVFSLLRTFGFDGTKVRADLFGDRDLAANDLLAYQQPSPELGFGSTLSSLMTHPEHGPLFFLVAWGAAPAFHSPVAGLRGTSALLSLLLVPAMFWLVWELFEDPMAAWIAAALAACSPMHLLYAQEARQYALWSALTAAASAALLHAWRRGRTSDWALYGILIALGLYTHLLFFLVLAAHGVYLLDAIMRRRSDAKALLLGWSTAVGAALLAFSPWLLLLLSSFGRVREVTAWMDRPVSLQRQLEAWGVNLVRVFADLPAADTLLLFSLGPLAWVLWRFWVGAPRAGRLFVCTLFLTFLAAVLVPDLIQGGSRSLHPRYALPGFLALQVATAYVLAAGWNAPSAAERIGSRAGLFSVLVLGVWSCWLILQADTWWSKNFSASNRDVAALVNATAHPLLIVSDSGVGLGEAISLAHELNDRVVIRGEPRGGGALPTTGFSDIFLLTPSAEIRAELSSAYDLQPLLNTWQWYRALPKSKGAGS